MWGKARRAWARGLAALMAGLLALAAPARSGVAEAGCLAVSGSRLTAAALAREDPRFLAIPAGTDFGYLPEPGERRTLALPTGELVCLERASRPLAESEIALALELPGTAITAAILDFPRTAFPPGKLRFPASGVSPPARGSDSVLWRGSIEYEPGRTIALWARVRLARETKCLRAAADIPKGGALFPSGIEATTCDAAAILAGALEPESRESVSASHGRFAARPIRKGEWLTAGLLIDAAMVVARREAMLELRSGGVRLVLPVMPEENGRAGDAVWVRSMATRERLQARVSGPDTLTLTLPGREPRTRAAALSSAARPDWRTP